MHFTEEKAQAILDHIKRKGAKNGPYFAAAVIWLEKNGHLREISFDPPILGSRLSKRAIAKARVGLNFGEDTLDYFRLIAEKNGCKLLDDERDWEFIGATVIVEDDAGAVAAIGVDGRRPFQECGTIKISQPHNHELACIGRDFYKENLRT